LDRYGIPGVAALLPLIPNRTVTYGVAGTWCWVTQPTFRLVMSYVTAWSTCVVVLFVYISIIIRMRMLSHEISPHFSELQKQRRLKTDKELLAKLAAFPIIYLIQWIPASINLIQNVIAPDHPITLLYAFHIFFVTSSGFMNSICYGKNHWRQICKIPKHISTGSTDQNSENQGLITPAINNNPP